MWLAQTEGAKFWLSVLTELQNRGLKDLFIACVDGLTGCPKPLADTYAIMHGALGKVTRNHRIFPSDEAVYKVVYLAIRNIAKKWTMPIRDWKPALNRFTVEFAERFPK